MESSKPKLDRYLAELAAMPFLCDENVRDSCTHMISYYRKRAGYKRRAFRTTSVLLILLGASLPAVAAFVDGTHGKVVLSIMSALIAFLTGLIAHFRWEVGWRSQTEAMFALKAEKSAWDTSVAYAKSLDDEDAAIKFLAERYELYRTHVFEIARGERGKFFKAMEPPGVKLPGS